MGSIKSTLLIAVLATTAPAMGRASFVVSPMEHHLSVPAGARGSSTVLVRNTGERPLTLKLYLADSRFDSDGREEELALGNLERSCAPWTRLATELLSLEPGEMHQVAISLAAPEDARGSYWTKLYIEEISTPEPVRKEASGRSYRVYMRQRMGVRIFENVPGTEEPGAVVSRVQIMPAAGTTRQVMLTVQNTGNLLLRCRGRVEVRNSHGDTVEVLQPGTDGEFLVFPGRERDLPVEMKLQLPDDLYTVLAVVDYGGESLVAGEEFFRVGRPTREKGRPQAASRAGKG